MGQGLTLSNTGSNILICYMSPRHKWGYRWGWPTELEASWDCEFNLFFGHFLSLFFVRSYESVDLNHLWSIDNCTTPYCELALLTCLIWCVYYPIACILQIICYHINYCLTKYMNTKISWYSTSICGEIAMIDVEQSSLR